MYLLQKEDELVNRGVLSRAQRRMFERLAPESLGDLAGDSQLLVGTETYWIQIGFALQTPFVLKLFLEDFGDLIGDKLRDLEGRRRRGSRCGCYGLCNYRFCRRPIKNLTVGYATHLEPVPSSGQLTSPHLYYLTTFNQRPGDFRLHR